MIMTQDVNLRVGWGMNPLRAYLERHIHISRVTRLSAPADTSEWLDDKIETLSIPLSEDRVDLIQYPCDSFLVRPGRFRCSPGFQDGG